jgi:tetratricopeptide (TPR) repeat protein
MNPRIFKGFAALALLVSVSACVTDEEYTRETYVPPVQMNAFLDDKPAMARKFFANIPRQGIRNEVLNHQRAALAAMQLNDFESAAVSLDAAINRIETIYANNEKAEKARSNFTKEDFKDYLGEPYERAMAHLYRGLIYMAEGDYQNARAVFKGGLLQDSYAVSETHEQDYASLAFLGGWASKCDGNAGIAKEMFDEAAEHNDKLGAPPDGHNLLLIADVGTAPTKRAEGEYDEKLIIEQGKTFDNAIVRAKLDGEDIRLTQAEDIFWQATTRGGRAVDHLLAGKAQFKDNLDKAGDVMIAGGAAAGTMALASGNNDAAAVAVLFILAGAIAKASAAAAQPDADIRYWDNLPDRVYIATAEVDEVPETVNFSFSAEDASARDYEMQVHKGANCSIAWGRTHSALNIPERAPGKWLPAIVPPKPEPKNSEGDKDGGGKKPTS